MRPLEDFLNEAAGAFMIFSGFNPYRDGGEQENEEK